MASIKELMVELDDETLLDMVNEQLKQGVLPMDIISQCQEGMTEIGALFAEGEMFVSDLMMAGAVCKEVTEAVKPYMNTETKKIGKVVMGTVKDDIHDIGKDIVCNMLEASGFEVIDVGIDTPVGVFVNTMKENPDCKVLGLSCLLASCYGSIKETVAAVKAVRPDVKIIIGGGPIDDTVRVFSDADAYAVAAQDTVNYCKEVYSV
ncbi:MAG: cobalamin-dependent protein [Lachnospiraceae bacterium]|nr:cobalamin-dependent protein [Lachnospiraceae bacterium]